MGRGGRRRSGAVPAIGGYPDTSLIGLSGLERMRAFRDGRVPFPPILYLHEIPLHRLRRHRRLQDAGFALVRERDGNHPGGMAAVLADALLGTALDSDLPPGIAYTTAEMSLTFCAQHPIRKRRSAPAASSSTVRAPSASPRRF